MKTSLLEEVEFFYLKFYYNKYVLTPRLETESLVREAIKLIKQTNIDVLIDVGLGSGIIPISIEKNIKIDKLYGLEKSSRAIALANINKTKHNSNIKIIKSDLLSFFFENKNFDIENKNILITANLPYIKNDDWINMSEDTRFEPKMALFGGKNTGFELYEKFYNQILKFKLIHNPNRILVIVEIGFDQREIAKNFLEKIGIQSKFSSDLRNIQRFIISEM